MGVELLSHYNKLMVQIFEKLLAYFRSAVPVYIPTCNGREMPSPRPSQHLVLSPWCIITIQLNTWQYLTVVFICIFLMAMK